MRKNLRTVLKMSFSNKFIRALISSSFSSKIFANTNYHFALKNTQSRSQNGRRDQNIRKKIGEELRMIGQKATGEIEEKGEFDERFIYREYEIKCEKPQNAGDARE